MPEESVYSPENPQNVIDSFVRPIWYHELLTDETKELLAQSRQDLKDILHKGHMDISNMIAVPSGGARWRLSGQDPTNYQFLFDGDIPPRDELRHEFNGQWILPREWDSVGHAMKHQDRSNALKALMITPDGHSRIELSKFITPAIISDHRTAPVNSLGYLRVMFTVENVDEMVSRLMKHGAQLVGEIVQYENSYRLCYIRGVEGLLVGLAEEIGSK